MSAGVYLTQQADNHYEHRRVNHYFYHRQCACLRQREFTSESNRNTGENGVIAGGSPESATDSEQSTDDSDQRPLRIGLLNPDATEIEVTLRERLPEAELAVVGEDSNPLEVHAVDCLLADCSGPETQAAAVFRMIREAYPKKPLVIVTRGRTELNGDHIEAADRTAHVPRTDSGLPIPLVLARCKRVAERSLTETESEEPEEEAGSITRAVGLWLL